MMSFHLSEIKEEIELLRLVQNDRGGEFKQKIDRDFADAESESIEREELLSLVQYLDLTCLEPTDNRETIRRLCERSAFDFEGKTYRVAGLCAFSNMLPYLNEFKKGKNIKSVVVLGGFPHSQVPLEVKKAEVGYAIEHCADEIDICLNRGLFLSEEKDAAAKEIRDISHEIRVLQNGVSLQRNGVWRNSFGHSENSFGVLENPNAVLLKVILETGELKSLSAVYEASMLALENGADFIKTSTGKTPKGADKYSVCVMLLALRQYYRQTGELKGLKVAGGIRTAEDAVMYRRLFERFVGKDITDSRYFRIGCSSLIENLEEKITK